MISFDDMFVTVEAYDELAMILTFTKTFPKPMFSFFFTVNNDVSMLKSAESEEVLLDLCQRKRT